MFERLRRPAGHSVLEQFTKPAAQTNSACGTGEAVPWLPLRVVLRPQRHLQRRRRPGAAVTRESIAGRREVLARYGCQRSFSAVCSAVVAELADAPA